MRENFKHLLYVILTMPLFAACTGPIGIALIGADPTACPPSAIKQARQFSSAVTFLETGQSKTTVLSTLGVPTHSTWKKDKNGEKLELLFYRTGHKACSYMPTSEPYTPVVLYNNMYWGYGQQFANNVLR